VGRAQAGRGPATVDSGRRPQALMWQSGMRSGRPPAAGEPDALDRFMETLQAGAAAGGGGGDGGGGGGGGGGLGEGWDLQIEPAARDVCGWIDEDGYHPPPFAEPRRVGPAAAAAAAAAAVTEDSDAGGEDSGPGEESGPSGPGEEEDSG
jgi:hypothetical protein